MTEETRGTKAVKNRLLISVGLAKAIVPEAYYFPEAKFDEVHVLTTASSGELDFLQNWFRENAPEIFLTFTRIEGLEALRSEADHNLFEEVLFRWFLEKSCGELPYVCIAGGFKTMSAAMQKAAAWFGAKEVFHVLAEELFEGKGGRRRSAETSEEIAESLKKGAFQWIKMGAEDGWPQLKMLSRGEYPLTLVKEEGNVAWVAVEGASLRDELHSVAARSRNVAGAWAELDSLPFSILATWPPSSRAWLWERVNLEEDTAWIRSLPKVELHCHLGGFATHGELLQRVKTAAQTPQSGDYGKVPALPSGWPMPSKPISLEEYMHLGDATGSTLLRDLGCLREHCRLFYKHLLEENIRYAEIRCSPANYATPERSPWLVLNAIRDAFNEAVQEAQKRGAFCEVNLILIATRRASGDFRTSISRHLALAITAAEHWTTGCRVVGVDLAGYEEPRTRAQYFREEFTAIHRCGLALTVHAGENDDAESIWQAVFDLNARRLGHALYLEDAPELLRSVADRNITVEMCPLANYQIKGFRPMSGQERNYPLKKYLDEGVCVTVNTDNIGISAGSLSDNFLHAVRMCPELTRLDILQLISNAADGAFLSSMARKELRACLEAEMLRPF